MFVIIDIYYLKDLPQLSFLVLVFNLLSFKLLLTLEVLLLIPHFVCVLLALVIVDLLKVIANEVCVLAELYCLVGLGVSPVLLEIHIFKIHLF